MRRRAGQLELLRTGGGIGLLEQEAARDGVRWIVGVDEAGRGPIAGPVVAAAVLLDTRDLLWCEGIDDSKRLSRSARDRLRARILERAPASAVGLADEEEIARNNILGATLLAMRRAVDAVARASPAEAWSIARIWIDGNRRIPELGREQVCVVGGDARSYAIAAASILAKEDRDARMRELELRYPGYGFRRHAGYGTASHLRALAELGPCPAHRRGFAPVEAALRSGPSAAGTPAPPPRGEG